eukprot:4574759-Karenia_brevis.AAC.1
MMLLFRPWRGLHCVDFLEHVLGGYTKGLPQAEAWKLVHGDYLSWRRREIDEVASPFLNRSSPVTEEPAFDTKEWWACMISARMRNIELAAKSHNATPYSAPSNLTTLPVEAAAANPTSDQEASDVGDGE